MRDRITTKIVWDMETWEVLEHVQVPYSGIWAECLGGLDGMFGATGADKGIANSERDFMDALQNEQSTQFSQEQQAQQEVQQAWSPIVAGGAYQYGFSTAEDAALQSDIVNKGAEATQNTENAALLREQQQSGGAATAPTGATAAINAQIAATGAQATGTNLANEKLAGYEQGSKLFSEATGAEEDVAKLADPTGYAGAANQSGSNALQSQKYVDTMNANSLTSKLMSGAIEGGLQAGIGALTGGASTLFGGQGSGPGGGGGGPVSIPPEYSSTNS